MTSYGLKINTEYNLSDYKERIMTTAGDVVLFESGVYKIYCDGDTFIKHNITDVLMHITCISVRDDIKINIEARGEVGGASSAGAKESIVSDIYHQVISHNKNVEVNINTKGIVSGDAKIIYRSNIKNYFGENLKEIGSGTGNQKAEFLKMSDMSEVDAEPSIDILGDNFKSSHSFSVTHISVEKKNYLALHGYNDVDIEKEVKDSFLN